MSEKETDWMHKEDGSLNEEALDEFLSDTEIRFTKANSWDVIEKWFRNDPRMKKIYRRAEIEAYYSENKSVPSAMIIAVEGLLDKVERLEGKLDELFKSIGKA